MSSSSVNNQPILLQKNAPSPVDFPTNAADDAGSTGADIESTMRGTTTMRPLQRSVPRDRGTPSETSTAPVMEEKSEKEKKEKSSKDDFNSDDDLPIFGGYQPTLVSSGGTRPRRSALASARPSSAPGIGSDVKLTIEDKSLTQSLTSEVFGRRVSAEGTDRPNATGGILKTTNLAPLVTSSSEPIASFSPKQSKESNVLGGLRSSNTMTLPTLQSTGVEPTVMDTPSKSVSFSLSSSNTAKNPISIAPAPAPAFTAASVVPPHPASPGSKDADFRST